MDPEFWHQRWQANQIGFHEGQVNALLARHFDGLSLAKGSRVFLPLCGKTRDIAWLLSKDYRIAGAELSAIAVRQLFEELGVEPQLTEIGKLIRHSADGIDIFVGDIFDLSAIALGPVDAIYDRAAMVAFPQAMRERYAAHLMNISKCAPQFLISFEYDQSKFDGPPFSVTEAEIRRHYDDRYTTTMAESVDLADGLKGKVPATEAAWFLRPR